MHIELTKAQQKEIALNYINEVKMTSDGYKEILNHLFTQLHFAPWAWSDGLKYACKLCSKAYHVELKYIKEDIK